MSVKRIKCFFLHIQLDGRTANLHCGKKMMASNFFFNTRIALLETFNCVCLTREHKMLFCTYSKDSLIRFIWIYRHKCTPDDKPVALENLLHFHSEAPAC